MGLPASKRGQDPVAVQLDLVQPALSGRRLRRKGRELGWHELRPCDWPGRGPRLPEDALRPPGEDVEARGRPRRGILLLHQKPAPPVFSAVLPALFRAKPHHGPASFELLPVKVEFQLSGPVGGTRVRERSPRPAVPEQNGPGAVLARRNDALECAVFDGMVFRFHREPLLGGLQAGSPGYRPALQDAVEFEPEVVMEVRCRVLLDHEREADARWHRPALGLWRDRKRSLLPVLHERRGPPPGAGRVRVRRRRAASRFPPAPVTRPPPGSHGSSPSDGPRRVRRSS
jgi:hypothetical protein